MSTHRINYITCFPFMQMVDRSRILRYTPLYDILYIYRFGLKLNFFKSNIKVTHSEMSRLGNISCWKISQRNFKAHVSSQSLLYTIAKNSDSVHSLLLNVATFPPIRGSVSVRNISRTLYRLIRYNALS